MGDEMTADNMTTIPDRPKAVSEDEEEIDAGSVDELILDEINRRREEEKAMFQQVIDDCTKLQAEVERLESVKSDLEAKLDVSRIEMETVREQMVEQEEQMVSLRREVADLKKRNRLDSIRTDENLRTRIDSHKSEGEPESSQVDLSQSDDPAQATDHWLEVKYLRLRLQRMAKDDQQKTERVCRVEKELQMQNAVMEAIEREVGTTRMEKLRENGKERGREDRKRSVIVGNIIEPVPQSSVCIIS